MDTTNNETIDSEFYIEAIPDYSKIQVIFFEIPEKPKPFLKNYLKDNVLVIKNFWEDLEEEQVTQEFELKYSKDHQAYMVAEQDISKNSKLMELFFKYRVDFFTKEIEMLTFNTILYQG